MTSRSTDHWTKDVQRLLRPLDLAPERESDIAQELAQHLQDRFAELDAGALAARESLRDAAAQVRRLEIVAETVTAKAKRLSARQADDKADERELAHYARMMAHR